MNQYRGIKKLYFYKLLRTLSEVGELGKLRVLDFGCGQQELKQFVGQENYIGYDINKKFSDIDDPSKARYDIMVANEVFYEMTEKDIRKTIETLEPKKLLVGISRQGLLNKLGSFFLAPEALDKTLILPKKELEILENYYQITKHKSVWGLADVYLLER